MHDSYHGRHALKFAVDRDRSVSPRPAKRLRANMGYMSRPCHDPWTPHFHSPASSPAHCPGSPEATYTDSPVGSPSYLPITEPRDDVTWLELMERAAETYAPPSTNVSPIGSRRVPLPAVPASPSAYPPSPSPASTSTSASSDRPRVSVLGQDGGAGLTLDMVKGGEGGLLFHHAEEAVHHDKPFKCSMCPKSFTRNYDLTRHKSSHQDERQYVCGQCSRAFNRRDALNRHNMVLGCGQQQQQPHSTSCLSPPRLASTRPHPPFIA